VALALGRFAVHGHETVVDPFAGGCARTAAPGRDDLVEALAADFGLSSRVIGASRAAPDSIERSSPSKSVVKIGVGAFPPNSAQV
jgi:hypothetical protein